MAEHEAGFPVDSYRDAARYLRRPFTPAAVKFKVQSSWDGGALIVSYIDARLVVERFNLVCPDLWTGEEYEPLGTKHLICRLTVDGITRQDIGEGQGKGLFSDALKRAAVKFGIGVSLYAIPKMILNASDGSLKARRDKLEMTPKGEQTCRSTYARWLDAHGVQAFGEPLDHGDVDDAAGDPEETREPVPVDAATGELVDAAPALTDERALGQLVRAGEIYDEIKGLPGGLREIPAGKFNAWVAAAHHSHERLDALIAHLEGERDRIKAAS